MMVIEVRVLRSKGLTPYWLEATVEYDSLNDELKSWFRDQLTGLEQGERGNSIRISNRPTELSQDKFDYVILITDEVGRRRQISISEESLDSQPILTKFLRSLVFIDDRHIFDNPPVASPEQRLQKKPKFRKPK